MATLRPFKQVYGKPWSKLAQGLELTPDILLRVGTVIAEEIGKEARKDYLRTGRTPRGEPMGLPNTPRFFDSFSAEVIGESTIGIRTTWPWAERHIEGRDSFKMWWLTQSRGVYKVPIVQPDGSILLVATPPTLAEAWVHPGALKFNFVSRGIKKGRPLAAKILLAELMRQLASGDPTK